MFWNKRKLMQIGPTAAVDPSLISAIYTKGSVLVIRFSGIGVIELESKDLFDSIETTWAKLAIERNNS